jgi:DNA-binding LacI/PurR family transcriptional regulator
MYSRDNSKRRRESQAIRDHGRTRVGLVGGDPRTSTGMERSLGFTLRMEELGHPLLPASMNHICDFTHEAGMLRSTIDAE